jgi:hypothetical protein
MASGAQAVPSSSDDNFDRQWFSYVADVSVVASAVQQPYQLQILADADFELWWVIGNRTSGSLKVLMQEQATGRQFIGTTASTISGAGAFNGINFDNWCGMMTQQAAFPLAVPFVMPATRTYTLLFTDSSAATNVVEVVFSGFKLWTKGTLAPASGLPSQAGSTARANAQSTQGARLSGWH